MFPPLWIFLVAGLAASLALREKLLIATAAVLLATWIADWTLYEFTLNDHVWQAKAAIDTTACCLVLLGCCRTVQIAVAAIYIAMLLAHAGFAVAGESIASIYYYWWILYYLAVAQAVVLWLWIGHDVVELVGGGGARNNNPLSHIVANCKAGQGAK